MSFPRRGVLQSAPAVWFAGLALLGAPVAAASVVESTTRPSSPPLLTTWSGRDVTSDPLVRGALPESSSSRTLHSGSSRSTPAAPLPVSADLATPGMMADSLLGAGIPPTYRPATKADNAPDDTATAALSKPKVEESLLVPVPAIGAGWALILGAGMYQIGARALRLRR
jgi:hypothetical protein